MTLKYRRPGPDAYYPGILSLDGPKCNIERESRVFKLAIARDDELRAATSLPVFPAPEDQGVIISLSLSLLLPVISENRLADQHMMVSYTIYTKRQTCTPSEQLCVSGIIVIHLTYSFHSQQVLFNFIINNYCCLEDLPVRMRKL